ncbi:MAG: heat-inducible transcriptional repressor HrcA [Candidatus Neomarinimicrobiota bacterium]
MIKEQLSERERSILAVTVKDYIQTAQPVASNRVRNVYKFPISAATIRNTMAALERAGYLIHPHTSAGKIPTDKGYRTYVNQLMVVEELNAKIVDQVRRSLDQISGDVDKLLRIVAHIISQLSGAVGITITPFNPRARLRLLRLIPVSYRRMLIVLELDGGSVRTVVAEGKRTVEEYQIAILEEILNERLGGLILGEIQATIGPRLEGTLADDLGFTTLIVDHSSTLFDDREQSEMYIYGLRQVLTGPEFVDQSNVVTLVSLLENEERLRELLLGDRPEGYIHVTIGHEHEDEELETFATISQSFHLGNSLGTLAVLAPKRVNYPLVFAVLEFMSHTVSKLIEDRA